MKITNVVYNLLLEQVTNKKILNFCIEKWFGQNASDEEKNKAEDYLEKFSKVKGRFKEETPEIVTFLNRFKNFDPKFIKNEQHYSKEQMIFILNDYYSGRERVESKINIPKELSGKTIPVTQEAIELSKKLWYEKNPSLIIDEDGFRVYKIHTKQQSIAMGFYSQNTAHRLSGNNSLGYMNMTRWCVTYPDSGNLWVNYRTSHNRTFYFVIDESRTQMVQEGNTRQGKYFISALQYDNKKDATTKYRITSMMNDGDSSMDESQVLKIYPKLANHLNLITPTNYNSDIEQGVDLDEVEYITEQENSRYEFASVNNFLKEEYISLGKIITKEKSWRSMNQDLRSLYINSTTNENMFTKFSTKEILKIVESDTKNFRHLDNRIKSGGHVAGFKELYAKLMSSDYIVDIKKSLKGHAVSLYQSRTTKKYGLFDKLKGTWLEKNGITYDDEYFASDDTADFDIAMPDNHDEIFTAQLYRRGPSRDNTSFVFLSTGEEEDGYSGYFLSEAKWQELKSELDSRDEYRDNGDDADDVNFDGDNEDQADLNEIN